MLGRRCAMQKSRGVRARREGERGHMTPVHRAWRRAVGTSWSRAVQRSKAAARQGRERTVLRECAQGGARVEGEEGGDL